MTLLQAGTGAATRHRPSHYHPVDHRQSLDQRPPKYLSSPPAHGNLGDNAPGEQFQEWQGIKTATQPLPSPGSPHGEDSKRRHNFFYCSHGSIAVCAVCDLIAGLLGI